MGIFIPLQSPEIFKPSRILSTTTQFVGSSDRHFIPTSANWLDIAGRNSSLLIVSFFYLFVHIYLNHLKHASPYLIGHAICIWNQQINLLFKYILWCCTNPRSIPARFLSNRWATSTLTRSWRSTSVCFLHSNRLWWTYET